MTGDFNSALMDVIEREGGIFVDMEQTFRQASPDSIIGNNLIVEHLHPNDSGYFLMAKEFAAAMRKNNLLTGASTWSERDTVDDSRLRSMSPLTRVDMIAAERRTSILVSAWPFTHSSDPPPPFRPSETLEVIVEDLLEGRRTWEQAHAAAATFYEENGQGELAAKEYSSLITMIPLNVSP